MVNLPPATAGQGYTATLDSGNLEVYVNGDPVDFSVSQVAGKWVYEIDGADVVLPGPIQFKDGDKVVAEAEIQQP